MIDTCKHCGKKSEILTFRTGEKEYVDACNSCKNDLSFVLRVIRHTKAQYAGS